MDNNTKLKIVVWNANGLNQHASELKQFIIDNSIDILLITETHFSNKSFIKIPKYSLNHTNHPSGRARAGSAIIIRQDIKYNVLQEYAKDYIQATTIQIEDACGPLILSALYCPPKFTISPQQYSEYIKTLGPRFIAGGDFNAKHADWGSRLTNKKGKNLMEAITKNNCKFISTGEPTYWPSDIKKKPDLIDFCITKNINHNQLSISSCLDLSSDHSPIIVEYFTITKVRCSIPSLTNHKTDWDAFRRVIDEKIDQRIPLKTHHDLENAIIHLNDTIHLAATRSTPEIKPIYLTTFTPKTIRQKIKEKRKLRKIWQRSRSALDKANYNKSTKELKDLLKEHNNQHINTFLTNLTATQATNYSLWKLNKKLKKGINHQPPLMKPNGTWSRTDTEKAKTLAEYFKTTFTNGFNRRSISLPDRNISTSTNMVIKKIRTNEIKHYIKNNLKCKKSPGYDLITGEILKELSDRALIYIRNIFNAILRLDYYPKVWKVSKIIAIPKPGKDATRPSSYRPISLLPIVSKIFEKLLLDRINIPLTQKHLIPDHQFGFRQNHSTIQQVHRVTNKILNDLNEQKYCVAVYLDIAKAFDSVWHKGLLFKLKSTLPDYHQLIKSYLDNRHFYVQYNDEHSNLREIEAGVPQGSVLGPILYLLFTADIPKPLTQDSMLATFADDTVILSSHSCLQAATNQTKKMLDKAMDWFYKWGVEINEEKTVQVIYTTKRNYKPQDITINNKKIILDNSAKYLGILIDNKLTWKPHIIQKRNQIKNKFRQLYWLLGNKSKLSIQNKLLIYKSTIKPIWTYGIQIWGTAAKSNIDIIQRLQSKILRTIVNAPWYITNEDIHRDLKIPSIKDEIKKHSRNHQIKISNHLNNEIRNLPHQEANTRRRLKRLRPVDLQSI